MSALPAGFPEMRLVSDQRGRYLLSYFFSVGDPGFPVGRRLSLGGSG